MIFRDWFLKSKALLVFSLASVFVIILLLFLNSSEKTSWFVDDPEKETVSKSFTFIAFGDSRGGSSEQKELSKLMVKSKPQIVISTGDLTDEGSMEQIQNDVLKIYKEFISESKFYPSLGNHDYSTDNGQSFVEAFDLPGNEKYYYFGFRNVLFVGLDSNDPLGQTPNKMISWLKKILLNQSKNFDWVIVYLHHPPYSSGSKHGSDLRVREKVVPLLEEYEVDVVFSGHDHNYQRTCEILNNTCVEDGVLHIVTAGGGAPLYSVGEPEWFTQTQASAYHFVKGEVAGCRLKLEAIDINNKVIDYFSLSKCPN